MSDKQILEFVKFNLGLTLNTRDAYLLHIIEGARAELKNSCIDPDGQDEAYTKEYDSYLIDYASWLYRARGGDVAMPQHLRFRRNNLIVGHSDV